MKRNIQLILVFLISFGSLAYSQISINDSTFPKLGDTLLTLSVADPEIDIKSESVGLQTWDFSELPTNSNKELTVVKNASEGTSSSSFPEADLLIEQLDLEVYYDVSDNKMVEIGVVGVDPILGLFNVVSSYVGERVYRRAPLNYNNEFQDNFQLRVQESVEMLPEDIQQQISALGADSIRLTTNIDESIEVNAYGELKLPGSTYDVLRVQKTDYINTKLFARQPLLGWIEINQESVPIDEIADFIGLDTVITYQFFTNDEVQPLAEATMSQDEKTEVSTITYKDEGLSTSVNNIIEAKTNISAYPNPTFGDIVFELENYPRGDYKVEVYNIIGKKITSRNFKPGTTKLQTNLGDLRKGTYLYSIIDENGNKMTTKRLVVITP